MIKDGTPYFIDYQGGRRGPAEYDIVSFVTQARANFHESLREHLIETYIKSASRFVDIDVTLFKERVRLFSLLRMLQVLGAYGFRGKFERKPHFLKSIPMALENLRHLLSKPFDEFPYITEILGKMLDACHDRASKDVDETRPSNLTVTVTSFSYKRGLPKDTSGNGGGFVFDCRGMENRDVMMNTNS